MTNQLHEQQQPRPPYADLELKMSNAVNVANAAYEHSIEIIDASDEATQLRIDKVSLVELYAQFEKSLSVSEGDLPITEQLALDYNVPHGYVESIKGWADGLQVSKDYAEQLEQFAPLKEHELSIQLGNVISAIGYDRFAEVTLGGTDEDENMAALSREVFGILNRLGIGQDDFNAERKPLGFFTAREYERQLTLLCETHGLNVTEGITEQQVEKQDKPFDLLADYLEVTTEITAAMELYYKYQFGKRFTRAEYEGALQLIGTMSTVGNIWDELSLASHDGSPTPNLVLPKVLFDAYNRHILEKLSQLPSHDFIINNDEAAAEFCGRSLDVEPILAAMKIEVSGDLKKLPFKLRKQNIRNWLANNIPGAALDTIRRVEFRELTDEEKTEDTWAGICSWSDELGGHVIAINTGDLDEKYANKLTIHGQMKGKISSRINQSKSRKLTKSEMLDTLGHECAHALHNVMPVAMLRQWDDVRAKEGVNVTAYVKKRFEEAHAQRFMEDFAESMMLFVQRPETLKLIAPERFQAMTGIFDKLKKDFKRQGKLRQAKRIELAPYGWRSDGKSPEDIKEEHFWYEKEGADES